MLYGPFGISCGYILLTEQVIKTKATKRSAICAPSVLTAIRVGIRFSCALGRATMMTSDRKSLGPADVAALQHITEYLASLGFVSSCDALISELFAARQSQGIGLGQDGGHLGHAGPSSPECLAALQKLATKLEGLLEVRAGLFCGERLLKPSACVETQAAFAQTRACTCVLTSVETPVHKNIECVAYQGDSDAHDKLANVVHDRSASHGIP